MSNDALRRDQPPPFPRTPSKAGRLAWPAVDAYSSRPGYGLTIDRVWRAWRQAEQGAPAQQCDVIEDVIENDGHLRGQYLSRVKSVAERPVLVQPGGDDSLSISVAALLQDALDESNFDQLLWHLMDAIFYSYTAARPSWEYVENRDAVLPVWFWIMPSRRFRVDENDALRLVTDTNVYPGEALLPAEWITAFPHLHRKIVRAGLMRTAVWWAVFKRLSVRDWMVLAEKFGVPFVIGSYEDRHASDANRLALEKAVKEIGEDGCAVLSQATKIQIEYMKSGDVSTLHPSVTALCNAEISKLFTGATLSTDGGGPGSFALGKVHENRSLSLTEGDALWVERIVKKQVVTPFMHFNGLVGRCKSPRVKVITQPDTDLLTWITATDKAQQMGLEVDSEQVYEKGGWRRPTPRTALKRPEPTPARAAPAAE
jgi:phage gp29-like protein